MDPFYCLWYFSRERTTRIIWELLYIRDKKKVFISQIENTLWFVNYDLLFVFDFVYLHLSSYNILQSCEIPFPSHAAVAFAARSW